MEIYVYEAGRIIATLRGDELFIIPGVDPDTVAFALFKMLNKAVAQPRMGVAVTWGTNYMPAGNVGGS